MKKLLLLLMLLCSGVLWMQAEETTTFSVSSSQLNGSSDLSSVTSDEITLKFSKGSGNSAPALNGAQIRFYGGNTLEVSGASNITITRIVITTINSYNGSLTATNCATSLSNNVWTITPSTTISSTTISNGTSSSQKQARISEIVVSYDITKTDVTKFEFSADKAEAVIGGDAFTEPTLTVEPEEAAADVAYESNNVEVATVDASTGKVTLVDEGEAVITAKISGSKKYNDVSDSYTLTVTKAQVKVNKPVITAYNNQITIKADEGNSIYYTLDGTDPTNESALYTEPFDITKDCTIKAIAYDSDGDYSIIVGDEFKYYTVAAPKFSTTDEYVEPNTIIYFEKTADADIYYRIGEDGEFTIYDDNAVITITAETTIYAYAKALADVHKGDSEIVSRSYKLGKSVMMVSTITAEKLQITGTSYAEKTYEDTETGISYKTKVNSDANGTYFALKSGNGGLITTSNSNNGIASKIVFTQYSGQTVSRTVDVYGSNTPYTDYSSTAIQKTDKLTTSSITLSKGEGVTFDLSELSTKYQYIAVLTSSSATMFTSIDITWQVISDLSTVVVNDPKISNDGNLVTITPADDDNKENTSIYYTLDGTDPTNESTLYTEPFSITENCTVKAIAYVDATASKVVSQELTLAKVEAPTLSYASGNVIENQKIIVTCGTPDAKLYYSFLGVEYECPGYVILTQGGTLTFRATRENYIDSDVVTAEYEMVDAIDYSLVTSADEIVDGGQYLIAHNDDSVVLGKYNNKNFFPSTSFVKDDKNNKISVADGNDDVTVVTIVKDEVNGNEVWNLKATVDGTEKYLCGGSTSNNVNLSDYQVENDGDISSFEFDSEGKTSIIFNSTTEDARNYFNYGGTYFSCYPYDRKVKLYKLVEATSVGEISVDYPAYFATEEAADGNYYVMTGTEMTFTCENATSMTLKVGDNEPTTKDGNAISWASEAEDIYRLTVTASAEGCADSTLTIDIAAETADVTADGVLDRVISDGSVVIVANAGALMYKVEQSLAGLNRAYAESQDWAYAEGNELTLSNDDFDFTTDATYVVYAKAISPIAESAEISVTFDGLTISGVESVAVDANAANAAYYNLQGQRVANPVEGALYIRVNGNRAEKVVF